MKRYGLARLNRKPRTFPKNCDPGTPGKFPVPTDGESFIDALNREAGIEPAAEARRSAARPARAASASARGSRPRTPGCSPEVLDAALRGSRPRRPRHFRPAPASSALQQAIASGGWLIPTSDIGDYGTDYEFRAQIAVIGLGANTPDEAIYPTGITDSTGGLLDGAQRLSDHLPARRGAARHVLLVADRLRQQRLPDAEPASIATRSARATRRWWSSRTARSWSCSAGRRADRGRRQLAADAGRRVPAQPAALRTAARQL